MAPNQALSMVLQMDSTPMVHQVVVLIMLLRDLRIRMVDQALIIILLMDNSVRRHVKDKVGLLKVHKVFLY
jgi:hypothetical protein